MLGESTNETITKEVLDKLFESIKIIGVLRFVGGESLIDLKSLEETLEALKKHKVAVFKLQITTNGSLYTEKVERILDKYKAYIQECRKNDASFNITNEEGREVGLIFSADSYHEEYMKKLENQNRPLAIQYYQNMERLFASPYYYDSRDLLGIWEVGKATELEEAKGDVDNYRGFYYEDPTDDYILVAPCINVLTDGSLTENNGSIEDLKTRFNYGNILETDIADLIKEHYTKCHTHSSLDEKQANEVDRFNSKHFVFKL